MEDQIRKVVISDIAINSLEQIYEYGIETFAYNAATIFIDELQDRIDTLATEYLLHPECKFLKTKSTLYRNVIHGNYLVIYRVTDVRVEVLNIIHGSRSISYIKTTRKIKI